MANKALLIMNVQVGVLNMVHASPSYFDHLSSTTSAARSAGLPIIYVKSSFRPGLPDVSPRNKAVARVRALGDGVFVDGSAFTQLHASVVPATDDVVVTKRRNSALAGTDLEVVLRSLGVEHVVLAGVMTSGVVLSTVRQAADMDYRITVLEDLCLDHDAEVQEVLMRKVFPSQAEVVSAQSFVESLKG